MLYTCRVRVCPPLPSFFILMCWFCGRHDIITNFRMCGDVLAFAKREDKLFQKLFGHGLKSGKSYPTFENCQFKISKWFGIPVLWVQNVGNCFCYPFFLFFTVFLLNQLTYGLIVLCTKFITVFVFSQFFLWFSAQSSGTPPELDTSNDGNRGSPDDTGPETPGSGTSEFLAFDCNLSEN